VRSLQHCMHACKHNTSQAWQSEFAASSPALHGDSAEQPIVRKQSSPGLTSTLLGRLYTKRKYPINRPTPIPHPKPRKLNTVANNPILTPLPNQGSHRMLNLKLLYGFLVESIIGILRVLLMSIACSASEALEDFKFKQCYQAS
jgi:hypothetical protein